MRPLSKAAIADILPLTLPILAEQALIVSMSTINAAMASNVGKEAASAVGMVDALTWVIIGFFTALELGGTVIVAQAWGRGDREGAERAAAQAIGSAIAIALALGALTAVFAGPLIRLLYPSAEPAVASHATVYLRVTALGYPFLAAALACSGSMRGSGDAQTPMYVNVAMNVVNVAASAILIYGLRLGEASLPALGVSGAAWGLTFARCIGAVAFLLIILPRAGRPRLSRLRITSASYFRPDIPVLKKVFSIGLPSAIENLTFNGGKLITQTYIVVLGTDAIAANYVASAIANFLQVPANSLGIAATTLVGQAVGKRDRETARRTLSVVVLLGSLSLLIVGIPCVPLAGALSSLYSRDPEVIRIAASLLRLNAIVSPFIWAVSFIMPSGFRGAGDATFPMAVSMASMWILRVSLGYVFALPLGMGVLGVWLAMMIDWVARAIFFSLRLRSGKWLAKAAL